MLDKEKLACLDRCHLGVENLKNCSKSIINEANIVGSLLSDYLLSLQVISTCGSQISNLGICFKRVDCCHFLSEKLRNTEPRICEKYKYLSPFLSF